MHESAGKICRNCLLREMAGREAEKRREEMEEWIASISPPLRARPEETERRIALCRTCPHLDEGTCRLCGCYVEYRAAFELKDCPDLPSRWEAESDQPG